MILSIYNVYLPNSGKILASITQLLEDCTTYIKLGLQKNHTANNHSREDVPFNN